MQTVLVEAVCDVESLVLCHGVWIDSLRWRDRVFPFFLHLGVCERCMYDISDVSYALRTYILTHDEERIMR